MILLLVASVQLPPHGRINYKCYSAWNAEKSNLDVVWNGVRYSQPWTFNTEVDAVNFGCTADGCVQRLWCTDSGAAGYYGSYDRNSRVPLRYTWLEDPHLRGKRELVVQGQEGDATVMTWTSSYGPGTLLVLGSTLFFYTFQYNTFYGLPRLSSLVFAEYQAGRTADELVSQPLVGFNVLGYTGAYKWAGFWSPIYPAGASALTISVEDFYGSPDSHTWAIDVPLSVSGAAATRGAFVLSHRYDTPSVPSAAREVLTVPGFACRAFSDGAAPLCHDLDGAVGKFTWAGSRQKVLGFVFEPLCRLPSFNLPTSLWLHDAATLDRSFRRSLVAGGLGSIVAFSGRVLHGVETLPDPSCPSGRRLFFVRREVPALAELCREPLACEWRQIFPGGGLWETPYAATAVKWPGPWSEGPLFVATDIERHEYHEAGTPDTSSGDPSLEHVYNFNASIAAVRIDALSCPWAPLSPLPLDDDLLRESVRQANVRCARLLLESGRGNASGVSGKGPLLLDAPMPEVALLLVDYGADLETKNGSGWTSLMVMARSEQPVEAHLARGAAVCTWPRNVYDLRWWSGSVDAHRHPCEPSFWLGAGDRCTGLTLCEPGHFCPGHRGATNRRVPCPAGTYGPQPGMASATQCRRCPSNRPFSPPGSSDSSMCAYENDPAWDVAPAGADRPTRASPACAL